MTAPPVTISAPASTERSTIPATRSRWASEMTGPTSVASSDGSPTASAETAVLSPLTRSW
jgi:hypothetical protein